MAGKSEAAEIRVMVGSKYVRTGMWESSVDNGVTQGFVETIGLSEGWGAVKGDPFQGPKVASCLSLTNKLSEETHVQAKPETLLGRGTPGWRAAG